MRPWPSGRTPGNSRRCRQDRRGWRCGPASGRARSSRAARACCCARAAAASWARVRGRWICDLRSRQWRQDDRAGGHLAARARYSKRTLPSAAASMTIVSVSPGPTGLRNLAAVTWQPRADCGRTAVTRRGRAAHLQRRVHGRIEQDHPGENGSAGKMAGKRRVIRRDGQAWFHSCMRSPSRCARASACSVSRGSLPVGVARQGVEPHQGARQEDRVDALAQRREERRVAQPRGDDEGDQADDRDVGASSGGIQKAPSMTPAMALSWWFR